MLKKDNLEELHNELKKYLSRITFTIECKDLLKREFDNFSDFIQFENISKSEILVLRITGYNIDHDTALFLRFDKDSSKNIHIMIDSNEDNVFELSEFFERQLDSTKPWYYPVSRKGIPVILSVIFGNSALVYNIIKGNYNASTFSKIAEVPSLYVVIFILLCLSITPLYIWLLNRFEKFYFSIFPKGVFAINQGLKRYKDKEIVRTVVVVAFIISFVSSLVVSLIFLFLT